MIVSFVETSVEVVQEINHLKRTRIGAHLGKTHNVREKYRNQIEALSVHTFSLKNNNNKVLNK